MEYQSMDSLKPTVRAVLIIKGLKICLLLQILLILLQILITNSIYGVVFEIVAILFLFYGFTRLNYCAMIFYMFLNFT